MNVKGCVVLSACIYSVRYNSVMAYSSSVRNEGVWYVMRVCGTYTGVVFWKDTVLLLLFYWV